MGKAFHKKNASFYDRDNAFTRKTNWQSQQSFISFKWRMQAINLVIFFNKKANLRISVIKSFINKRRANNCLCHVPVMFDEVSDRQCAQLWFSCQTQRARRHYSVFWLDYLSAVYVFQTLRLWCSLANTSNFREIVTSMRKKFLSVFKIS